MQSDIVHAAMGLLGECVELQGAKWDWKNRVEETGDLEFYTEHAMQVLAKWEIEQTHGTEVGREEARNMERDPTFWITHWCGEFHNAAKKVAIHNKPVGGLGFYNALVRIRICLFFLANQMGMTRDDMQGENRKKLELRYPTGYSDAAAQARADKAEA